MKMVRDLPRAVTAAQQLENLQFTVAQLLDGRSRAFRAGTNEIFRHARGDIFADEHLSRLDRANALDDFAGSLAFHQVAARAGPQRAFGVERFVVHRKRQHRHARMHGLDVFDQFEAGTVFQQNIHHRHVRLGAVHQRQRLRFVRRLPAHFEVRLLLNQIRHAFPHEGMIVHQQNSNFLRHLFPFAKASRLPAMRTSPVCRASKAVRC